MFFTSVGAPLLGEHSREVMREVGYSDDDIASLMNSGVLLAANDDADQ